MGVSGVGVAGFSDDVVGWMTGIETPPVPVAAEVLGVSGVAGVELEDSCGVAGVGLTTGTVAVPVPIKEVAGVFAGVLDSDSSCLGVVGWTTGTL